MRPKSAMFYINDIEEISKDLTDLVAATVDSNNEVDDLLDHINKWSLESIIAIFLDMRINCLDKELAADSDARKFVNAVKIVLGREANDIASGLVCFFSHLTNSNTNQIFRYSLLEIHHNSWIQKV